MAFKVQNSVISLERNVMSYNSLDCWCWILVRRLSFFSFRKRATIYWARHTFATVGCNACRMSKDDVALALNHVDHEHRTTDIYIEKDWSIVDEVQIKVITLLRRLDIKIAAKQKKGAPLRDVA